MAAKTLFEKIWDEHVVHEKPHEPSLLYIDLHLIHEVTSPQAFEGLRHSGRKVRAPHRTYATQDHNVPTTDRSKPITDPVTYHPAFLLRDPRQKKEAWKDLQMVMKDLGLVPPPKSPE